MRASVLVLGAAICVAGCATTVTSGPRTKTGVPVAKAPPVCRPRSVRLAPQGKARGAAAIEASTNGYVLAWSEHAGERETLRFLALDRQGVARSPSAEIVDRAVPLEAPTLKADADGYVVAWREGSAQFARKVDGKGRARADMQASALGEAPAMQSRCTKATNGLRCTAPDGHGMDLPPSEALVTEATVGEGLALVSSGPDGLKLWLLDCAKVPAK